MTGLTAAHRGYEYQDLMAACRFVDVVLGTTHVVLVDEKLFTGDRFDDLTVWDDDGRERTQFKHTDSDDKTLTLATFTGDKRDLRLDLLVKALEEDPELADIEGYVEDSGEGRWTVHDALDQAVPVPTIAAAIFARFVSRQEDSPSMKAVAALRKQFGGHAVRKA